MKTLPSGKLANYKEVTMPAISKNKQCKSTFESEILLSKTEIKIKPKIKWSHFQERCLKMISELEKNEEESFAFKHKIEYYGVHIVDPQDYYSVIKKPMYLKKVCHKIKSGKYKDEFDVIDDVNLIFDNAMIYNNRRTKYYKIAKELQIKFNKKATKIMKNLGYCCGSSYKLSTHLINCNGAAKNCFIKLGTVYHIFNEFIFCDNCFKKEDDMIKVEDQNFVKKSDFEDKKMTNRVPDSYIKCVLCLRRFHQICVMYFEDLHRKFICVNCSVDRKIRTIKLTASALPQSNCSIFVQKELEKNNLNTAGNVTIRVLSDQEMTVTTKPQYSKVVGEFNISYRNRALFAFHKINGDDVCFFGAYFQVYDDDCSIESNRNTIYLSYLDSVNLKKYVLSRTKIYQQILLGLFLFYKQKRYKKVCLWSCPPKKRTDYIFNVKPVDQKIPNQKRLSNWYRDLFRIGMKSGVIEDFKNVLQYGLQQKWKNIKELPYFEGDLWPLQNEDSIKNSIAYLDEMSQKLLAIYMDLKSPCVTNDNRNKMMNQLVRIQNLTLENEIMQRTMKLLKYFSTDYFVVTLNTESTETERIDESIDNTIKSCEFINNRHKFMEFFVDNYYEFSDVRQSKYSSFMMIYELYKSHKMCQDCLEINVLDDALVPSLNCQRCSSKHKDDFKITDTALQSVEVIDVFMTNSVETDSSMEQFMLVKNTNKNIVDQLTLEKNNPYLNFNQDEIISHSPFVSIKKLDKEVVSYFLRNTNQIEFTKTKKLINQSKIIKKSSTKQNSARKVLDKILLNNTNHRSKNLTRKSSRSSNANSCNICKQNYLRTKVELH